MKKEHEEQYKKLNEKQLTRDEWIELAWAQKELAECFSAHNAWDALGHTRTALRYIHEFVGKMVPLPTLTEKEASISSTLHTYLRKGTDGPHSCLLYRFIDENYGIGVWYAFCKGLAANKMNYRLAMTEARQAADITGTSEDSNMRMALEMWEEEFPDAIEWMKQ